MPGHAAISIGDDLATGQAGVSLGAADHEAPGRIDEKAGLAVQVLTGNRMSDHVLDDLIPNLRHRNIRLVLGRYHHRIHPDRPVALVFHGNLGLAVRPQVRQDPTLAHLRQPARQSVSEIDRQGHQVQALVGGISVHHPLVSRPQLTISDLPRLDLQGGVHPQSDVGRLLVDGGDHGAGIAIKAEFGPGVTDLPHRFPGDVSNIYIAFGGDLPRHKNQAG